MRTARSEHKAVKRSEQAAGRRCSRMTIRGLYAWASRCLLLLALLPAGCGGDARVQLSAADALTATAGQVELTVHEYHQEVSAYDESRESEVVSAFVARVRADHADPAAVESHADRFKAALAKIRTDRDVEWRRRQAALDNVAVLRELARGLRRLALESLSLDDEMRRYLSNWLTTREKTNTDGR